MKKLSLGKTFKTEAIINDVKNLLEIDYLTNFVQIDTNNGFNLTYKMDQDDMVLGLGENLFGINKRGGLYHSFCTDEFNHTPDKKSLYGAHNFILIYGKTSFALFVDYPGKIIFDVGFTDRQILTIQTENPDLDLYLIEGSNIHEILYKFRKAIGKSYIPPKWAFGYQQSKWSYGSNTEILNLANNFKKNNIPCDAIYLDIDYMEDFKNFTIDNNRFPDFNNFVKEIRNLGFRLVPIIDAGCKIEDGYPIFTEGVDNNFFCTDATGKPFTGAVWPGKVHFPDFLNSNARAWFGSKYKFLTDMGIEGFWNDMNEPSIFYSEDSLNKAFLEIDNLKGKNLGLEGFFKLIKIVNSLENNHQDYKSFYHNVNGELINHFDVHNLYGYNMTRAASEALNKIDSNKRFLLFSRASYTGMHRYGGIWTGDNKSWWEHLVLNIKMMPSLNMLGFLYSGADIGGFGGDTTSELLVRWTQFGVFTPLFRNHCINGVRDQEPFAFDTETTDILRDTINLRYALIPYLYSEFNIAVNNYETLIKPIFFDYDDKAAKQIETQLLVGSSIMITPIYEVNSTGRNIYLPEDMLLCKFRSYNNTSYGVVLKGHRYLELEYNEIPVFIRKNKILLLGNPGANVESIVNNKVHVIAFIETKASYNLYNDDGISVNTENSRSNLLITIEKSSPGFKISTKVFGHTQIKEIFYTIFDNNGQLFEYSEFI